MAIIVTTAAKVAKVAMVTKLKMASSDNSSYTNSKIVIKTAIMATTKKKHSINPSNSKSSNISNNNNNDENNKSINKNKNGSSIITK